MAKVDATEKKVLCTNFARGVVHDFKLFKLIRLPFSKDILVLADTGYLGIELIGFFPSVIALVIKLSKSDLT